jgi:hypothetical protein
MSLRQRPEDPGRPGHRRSPEIDDQLLVRYVLGLLPDDQTELLDEASIADDDVAARLRVVEDDLVDGYVRGTLDAATLNRFESYYLSSPERREHVRFASSLIRAVDRAAPRADKRPLEQPAPGRPSESDAPLRVGEAAGLGNVQASGAASARRGLMAGLAAAAALLLAASASLLYQTGRLSRGLDQAQHESAALDRRTQELEQQLANQRAVNAETASRLARARESVPGSTSTPLNRANATTGLPAFALVLLPQTRAIGPISTLALSPGAERVAFDLQLETNDFPQYQVGLRDPATNGIIWRSDWMAPSPHADQATVAIVIPATLLKPQHFSIELRGREAGGGGQVVGSYAFQIVPR